QPDAERLGARVSRAFLGIRIDCAQCHNHPFERWTQRDFHSLAAFFAKSHQGFTGIYDNGEGEHLMEDRKTGNKAAVEARVPFQQDLLPADGTPRQRLAAWVTDPRNRYFAPAIVNRVWALVMGRPLVEPVDNMSELPSSEDVRLRDSNGQPLPVSERKIRHKELFEKYGAKPVVLRRLADDLVAHQFDLHRLLKVIAAARATHLDSAADFELTNAHDEALAAFPLTRLRPEQVIGSVLQAASLETVNRESHILVRLATAQGEKDFVERYGD